MKTGPITDPNTGGRRKRSRKEKIRLLLLVVLFAGVVCAFIHPFGRVKATASNEPLFFGAQIEPPVLSVFQRSCVNCHSEQTSWPLYSYVPPASWLVEKDVRDGREHFNMSRWDEYSAEQRTEKLAEISAMVRNRQMPLPRYLWIHSDAKLSDGDITLLDRWSHAERRRLKAQAAPAGTQ